MKLKEKQAIYQDIYWKVIMRMLFPYFMDFHLPNVNKHIDYEQPIEFLDKEFQKIFPDDPNASMMRNDKLVKVVLKNGAKRNILIHIEIEAEAKATFVERMFRYFYRIYDHFKGERITALAVYTGEKIPKIHNRFTYDDMGTKVTYEFNTFVVKDKSEEELLASSNPFALATLAIKYAYKTKEDGEQRAKFKLILMHLALERNYSRDEIIHLLTFIEFILILPKDIELKYSSDFEQLHRSTCLLYTSPSPRDLSTSRMPSSA